jgi:hypothetical protein
MLSFWDSCADSINLESSLILGIAYQNFPLVLRGKSSYVKHVCERSEWKAFGRIAPSCEKARVESVDVDRIRLPALCGSPVQ